jgi:hypothetical protein
MSIIKRGVGVLLLTAASLTAVGTIPTTRAAADDGECILPDCEMAGGQLAVATTWDPRAYEKLTEDFIVESARYSSSDRRISWTLRTKKPFEGEVGVAEGRLTETLETLFKRNYYCAFFYDAERRKVGSSEIFFTPGERDASDRFVVFADCSVANVEAFTAKVVVTLCERPPDYAYLMHMIRGESHLEAQRFDRAIQAFQAALQARPGDPVAARKLEQAKKGLKQP